MLTNKCRGGLIKVLKDLKRGDYEDLGDPKLTDSAGKGKKRTNYLKRLNGTEEKPKATTGMKSQIPSISAKKH